jgi:hypothetical protein
METLGVEGSAGKTMQSAQTGVFSGKHDIEPIS